MYLATIQHGDACRYQIRQSSATENSHIFSHDLIFDLGSDPTRYLEEVGETMVYFSTELENAVQAHTEKDADVVLEKLLWDFLPHTTRKRLERFDRSAHTVPGPLTELEKEKIENQIHIFDRRRLYYLYYRAIDQSRLFTMRDKVYRQLLDTSRDEREYHFAMLEKRLNPDVYRNYLYAALQLHRHFSHTFAPFLPEALPAEQVADHFVEELCTLNESPSFWLGTRKPGSLHPHLVRYLLMFFDYVPRRRLGDHEFVRQFMNSHRTFRWPERKSDISNEQIATIFGKSRQELQEMGSEALRKLYRKKALKLHPDQGGDQERFVELTEAYNQLQHTKRKKD